LYPLKRTDRSLISLPSWPEAPVTSIVVIA
jgi:hypothetical protein